ncbi:hypothetical protein HID58_048408 [Brassica napus]|uniref:Uncharacterized protein n=1 Tax=Brassica napus TaxID=3708 RepID=A0ABQ8B3M3_BRANA|nr:hypothetical protein HID58_048408 [Brassica napus]
MLSAPAWVSHSQRFTMSFNVQAALCFPLGEPLSALSGRHSMTRRLFLNLLCHGRADGRGGAAVFPALGLGSFRGTTPVEFDKYSKALYPPSYQYFQELLLWLLHLLQFVKVVNPAGRYPEPVGTSRDSYVIPTLNLATDVSMVLSSRGEVFPAVRTMGLYMTAPPSSAKLLGYFCVQAIRAQLYGMIGGRRHVIEFDKPEDPALRVLPYGYGPVYVVGALEAAGEIGR